MGDLKNEFSWSRSRSKSFDECARRYWFTYYGSWEGWEPQSPPRTRQAYILKQLQSRWMWVGSLVHDTVAKVLVSARAGRPIPEEQAIEEALQRMRAEFRASRAGEYLKRPKKTCGLFEHEYKLDLSDDQWGEAADHMKACVSAFYKSPWFEKLPRLPRGAWLPIEELSHFYLDGVKVFVKPDFAYRSDETTVEIIDWKTGRRDEEADPVQLACYALHALDQKWAAEPEQVVTNEYNLALGKGRETRMSAARLDEVKAAILASAAAMKQRLDDPARNVATESKFPVATDPSTCRSCNYRKICPDAPLKT